MIFLKQKRHSVVEENKANSLDMVYLNKNLRVGSKDGT